MVVDRLEIERPSAVDPRVVRIFLMRHAPSTWNVQHRFQGRADPPLVAGSVDQIRRAARDLPGFSAIVSSPLLRAADTARQIALLQDLPAPEVDPLWQERDVGQWEGLTRAEIDVRWPGYLERGERPEGWEPDEQVVERADAGGKRLAQRGLGGPILIVTHSGLIRSLERREKIAGTGIANLAGRWAMAGERGVSLAGELRSC
jgi:probable phosphoglycerate mutase